MQACTDVAQRNALHFACSIGRRDAALHLTALGHLTNSKYGADRTCLHAAVEKPFDYRVEQDEKLVQWLLNCHCDPLAADSDDVTPMHLAACEGHAHITEWLALRLMVASQGRKRNVTPRDKLGRTPLHYAAISGANESVSFLIDQGAELSAPDLKGWTPVHVAIRYDSGRAH